MKKLYIIFMLFVTLSFASYVSSKVSAQVDPLGNVCNSGLGNGGSSASVCVESNGNQSSSWRDLNPISGSGGILMRVFKLLAFVTGVASVIIIILSGLKYVTSDGDSNSINSAKHTLLYAVVGLIVSIVAQGIILFVVRLIN